MDDLIANEKASVRNRTEREWSNCKHYIISIYQWNTL